MKEQNGIRVINILLVPISQSHLNLIKTFKIILTHGVNCLLDKLADRGIVRNYINFFKFLF